MIIGWSVPFNELAKKAEADLDDVIRSVTIELFTRVIQKSPVDTGRLRANWFPSFGTYAETTTEDVDPSGSGAVSRASDAVLSYKVRDGIVYLTNSLPYARVIEYGEYPNPPKSGTKTSGGFSTQAPQGMVRVSAAEIEGIVRERLRS